jgi:imidazolonepropionase
MHRAAVNQNMSLDEALAASTINSAHSIGRSGSHGSIEKGKVADLVVIDAQRQV